MYAIEFNLVPAALLFTPISITLGRSPFSEWSRATAK